MAAAPSTADIDSVGIHRDSQRVHCIKNRGWRAYWLRRLRWICRPSAPASVSRWAILRAVNRAADRVYRARRARQISPENCRLGQRVTMVSWARASGEPAPSRSRQLGLNSRDAVPGQCHVIRENGSRYRRPTTARSWWHLAKVQTMIGGFDPRGFVGVREALLECAEVLYVAG
jgi:hypothetical protein